MRPGWSDGAEPGGIRWSQRRHSQTIWLVFGSTSTILSTHSSPSGGMVSASRPAACASAAERVSQATIKTWPLVGIQ